MYKYQICYYHNKTTLIFFNQAIPLKINDNCDSRKAFNNIPHLNLNHNNINNVQEKDYLVKEWLKTLKPSSTISSTSLQEKSSNDLADYSTDIF